MKDNRALEPLKIMQFATGFPSWGGTELHILNLSDQLQVRGHDVTIACKPGKWVDAKAKEMGLKTVSFDVDRLYDFHDFAKIRNYMRSERPDVLHAHWNTDLYAAGYNGMLQHVPVRILTRHLPFAFRNRLGTELYSKWLFTKVVTVSDSVRRVLLKSGAADNRIQVIHHGTNIELFQNTTKSRPSMRAELGLLPQEFVIGIVGRIAPEKGHRYLVEAMSKLPAELAVKMVVVGAGPDEAKIRGLVSALGRDDKVAFLGFRDDINNVIEALDVVAVPSTWDEPCSAVIQQAMALKKPVIGTKTGGSPEMIQEGVTGLLVPPSDSEALANAIVELARNRERAVHMGEEGFDRVAALFTLSGMVDKIEELYYSQLNRPPFKAEFPDTVASS
jgi:glycosyltransferase involved in cell wall biosynthesis